MPTFFPKGTNLAHITWISDDGVKYRPNRAIICPKCKGIIEFNIDELLLNKSRGGKTSTPCQFHKEDEYHLGFPPEPHLVLSDDGILTVEE